MRTDFTVSGSPPATPEETPATYAALSVLLLAASAATCIVPAWRAARLDPMAALRT